MSSQDKQVPASTLQGFSPSQAQDVVCVLSRFPQVAALPLTASAAPCSAVSSTQVMAIHLHGVLCLLPQDVHKDAELHLQAAPGGFMSPCFICTCLVFNSTGTSQCNGNGTVTYWSSAGILLITQSSFQH